MNSKLAEGERKSQENLDRTVHMDDDKATVSKPVLVARETSEKSTYEDFLTRYEKPIPAFKAPVEAWKSAVALGTKKAQSSIPMIFLLGLQAGIQLGIGSAMTVAIAAGLSGLTQAEPASIKIISGMFGLPVGLTMTVVMGSELFTGSCALVTASFLEGKCTFMQLMKNWIVSYIANVLGCAFLAWLCVQGGSMTSTNHAFATVATAKAGLTFTAAFVRGILCNWLVTTAVWLGQASSDLLSKVFMICLLITIFVALAFEHSVANMFVGAMGALVGGPTYWKFFVHNLIPVTLGNIIGGGVLTAGINWLAWGDFTTRSQAWMTEVQKIAQKRQGGASTFSQRV